MNTRGAEVENWDEDPTCRNTFAPLLTLIHPIWGIPPLVLGPWLGFPEWDIWVLALGLSAFVVLEKK